MTPEQTPAEHRNGRERPAPGPSFWHFVPLDDYRVPTLPPSGALAKAWATIRRALRQVEDPSLQPARDEARLRTLPQIRLDHLVAPLDPADPADALDAALYDWCRDDEPRHAVRFVVGQPHDGQREMLPWWAARHGATLIEPPTPAEILAGDSDTLAQFSASGPHPDGLWVIPDLARWYLRHSEGLGLVRSLLARAETGELGRGVIGCGSWAWAYLSRVWPVPRADALTAQAFDATRLTRLLTRQVERHPHRRVHFRHAVTGRDILAVPSDEESPHPEIAQLAAHCRGNPGTALAYWRESLRAEPESDAIATSPDRPGDDFFEEEHIWVSARLHEPILPNETDEDVVLVLHALLLHDGLPTDLLPELLPLTRDGCLAILLRLDQAGLVARRDDRWQVSPLGYAGVRALLRGRDYLIDAF